MERSKNLEKIYDNRGFDRKTGGLTVKTQLLKYREI